MSRNANSKKAQLMLDRKVTSLVTSMAMPPIIAQLITKVYNLVDAYFVSTLGTTATAAVGVNGSLEHTISMIGAFIGAGACSYISRLLGERREKEADRVLSTSFFSGLALGIIFAVFGSIFIVPLVRLLCSNPDSEPYAIEYATYVLMAAPFMVGSFILNMCLRSEGSSTYAMVGIAAGGILNCFLDPLFIYVFDLGVAGASMATAISKAVSFVILVWPYIRKKCSVVISIKKIKFVSQDVKEVSAIGATSFLRSACSVISSILINRVAGTFSTAALAAVSLGNRLMEFPFAIILGFSQGCQPVIGFNWGAKRLERVRECVRFSTLVAVVGSLVMGAVLFVFAEPILQIFNKQNDPEVMRLGVLCVKLQCFTLIFHSLGSVVNTFYSGIGKAKSALLISMARQGYCFVPVALTLPFIFGAEGVITCQAAADLLSMAVIVPLGIKSFQLLKTTEEVSL